MKKQLLFCLFISILMVGFSQSRIPKLSNPDLLHKKTHFVEKDIKGDFSFENPMNVVNNNWKASADETQLGHTYFDYVSNNGVGNRLHRWEDGTMAAVWTSGMEIGAYPDRGTGYNYFNGTTWDAMPTARIEDERCGWPTITAWGPNGEICATHTASSGLKFMRRETKGQGDWELFGYQGPAGFEDVPTFPQLITSGEDNQILHLIYNMYQTDYADQYEPMLYSRSTDGGTNWVVRDLPFEELGSDYYLGADIDDHNWVVQGNTIAFIEASYMNDLLVMKSVDNGENWEKIVIWRNPYPFLVWDGANSTMIDSLFMVDGSGDIAIDPTGKIHVVFGISEITQDETGRGAFPFVDGIGYWNEDMPIFNEDEDNINALAPAGSGIEGSEMIEDYNYIGWSQDINGDGEITFETDDPNIFYNYRTSGLSTQPQITIDEEGKIFVIYSSTTETFSSQELNFKHIWGRAFDNGGWGPFMDLTIGVEHWFDECVFPVIAKTSDDYIYYYYMADGIPGFGSGNTPDHDATDNRMVFGKYPKQDLLSGVSTLSNPLTMKVSQNTPNPATSSTNIDVHIIDRSVLSLEITNMVGQKIMELSKGTVNSGIHSFTVDTDLLDSGVYFYTVTAGKSSVTKKMIVQ